MKHTNKALALAVLATFFMSGISVALGSFSDVTESHENYDAINYVQDKGIVTGYPDGSFKADITINRAEFTKIVVNSKFDTATIDSCIDAEPFSDVPADEWYAKYICVAKMNNIIQGYPDGTFKPGSEINFVEAAKIIVATFDANVTAGDPWYKPYVENLAEDKAIPTSIKTFAENITRGEMAEMIYRLLANITNKTSLTYSEIENGPLACSTSTDPRDAIVQYLTATTDAEKRACMTDWAKRYPEYLVPEVNLSDVQPNGNFDEIRGIDAHSCEVDVYYWYGSSTTPVIKIFVMDVSSGNWLLHAIFAE